MIRIREASWPPANGLLLSIFEHPGIPNHLIVASRLDAGVALWTVSNCSAKSKGLQVNQLGVLNWSSQQSKITILTTQLNNEVALSVVCDASSHVQVLRVNRRPWCADGSSIRTPCSQDAILEREWLSETGFGRFDFRHRNWSIRGEAFGLIHVKVGDSSQTLQFQTDSAHPCYDPVLRRLYYGSTGQSGAFLQVRSLDGGSTPFAISAPDQLAYLAVSPNADRLFALGRRSSNLFCYHVDTRTWYPPVVLNSPATHLAVMSDSSGIWVATENSIEFHTIDYGFGTFSLLRPSNGEL